jgi:hypothetical protein
VVKPRFLMSIALIAVAATSPGLSAAQGLLWSTYLGGSAVDRINGTATDADGNVYVVGTTYSANLPATTTGFRSPVSGNGDVMVAKFNSGGTTLQWLARIGGSQFDDGRSIAVDAAGNVFVTGYTGSSDFSVSAGSYRTSFAGRYDGFITKLSPSGTVVFSSLFGGTGQDWPMAVRVDAAGNAVIAGSTDSYNFPTTPGVIRRSRPYVFADASDGFIVKFNAAGTGLVYGTYFGATNASDAINGLALDSAGQPIVVGYTHSSLFPTTSGAFDKNADYFQEGFVTRLNANATGYVFSSYVGGDNADEARAVAVDANDNVYVTGFTGSSVRFPTFGSAAQATNGGGWDAFLLKVNPAGTTLVYSTFWGGSGEDKAQAIVVSPTGEVTISGNTASSNLRTTSGAYDPSFNGGTDAFVARFSTSGQIIYSSFFGSAGNDRVFSMAAAPNGNVVLGGNTDSQALPTGLALAQSSSGGMDGFVSCLSLSGVSSLMTASAQMAAPAVMEITSFVQPNPFRDGTTIQLTMPSAGHVAMRLRDLQGRLVRNLADQVMSAGTHRWAWDGRNQVGESAAAGVYFLEVAAGGSSMVKKITRVQ